EEDLGVERGERRPHLLLRNQSPNRWSGGGKIAKKRLLGCEMQEERAPFGGTCSEARPRLADCEALARTATASVECLLDVLRVDNLFQSSQPIQNPARFID